MTNTGNTNIWAGGQVFIGGVEAEIPSSGTPPLPDGTPYGVEWDEVGILDGSEGFTEAIEMNSSDHFGWGPVGSVFLGSGKNQLKVTRTFTAFEDNETVISLRYPGSDIEFDGDGYAGDLAVSDLHKRFRVGFQTNTNGFLKRVTTANYATVGERGASTQNEDGVTTFPFTIEIHPLIVNGVPVFWKAFRGPVED